MEQVKVVNGLPKSRRPRKYSQSELDKAKANNQFVIQGTNPVYPGNFPDGKDIIVFLEYVQSTGTFTIEGIDDTTTKVLTGAVVSSMELSHSPLRLDGGVKLNGTILIAKGFYLIVEN